MVPAELLAVLDELPARRRGRGHRRVQPRHRDAELLRGLRRRRGEPALARRAVDGAPRAGSRSAAPTTRPTCAGASSWPGPRASTFNLDLIYGGAGESLDDWHRTLDEALALEPPHVSAYALTVEAGTPLAADPARHPDDDDQADKYRLADDLLGAAGLDWYEISNWARPGHECRHNLLYWTQGEYLGFGCAAHSHRARPAVVERAHAGALHRRRRGRARPWRRPTSASTPTSRRLEGLQLALRTAGGRPRRGPPAGGPPRPGHRRRRSRGPHPARAAAGQRGRPALALS